MQEAQNSDRSFRHLWRRGKTMVSTAGGAEEIWKGGRVAGGAGWIRMCGRLTKTPSKQSPTSY